MSVVNSQPEEDDIEKENTMRNAWYGIFIFLVFFAGCGCKFLNFKIGDVLVTGMMTHFHTIWISQQVT